MFCSQCGKRIPDGCSFCQFCGCKVQDISPGQNTMNAPGRPDGMGSTANAFTNRQRYTEAASDKKNTNPQKGLSIALHIILTLLIAVSVFIYKKRDGQILIQKKAEQGQQQNNPQIGIYMHHIGNAVFYTEHDLRKYIIPNENNPVYKCLEQEKCKGMLLFGCDKILIWRKTSRIMSSNRVRYLGKAGSAELYAVSPVQKMKLQASRSCSRRDEIRDRN